MSLNAFLEGNSSEAPAQIEQVNESIEAPTTSANDNVELQSNQADESTGETVSASPGATRDGRLVPLPALQEERKKRQDADRRLADLEARLQQLQNASHTQPTQQTDDAEFTDEDVYADLPKALKKVQDKFDSRLKQQRYESSEAFARRLHPDYDDVISQYADVVKSAPYLAHQVDASPTPALDAYEAVKQHIEAKRLEDPHARKALIDAEVAKQVAEQVAKLKGSAAAGSVPQSLTAARGSGASAPTNAWSGPPSWDDILQKRR